MEETIFVMVSGTSSLVVKDLVEELSYTVCTLFPGESMGDLNLITTLRKKEYHAMIYMRANSECDVLTIDRKEFTELLLQEMKDSLEIFSMPEQTFNFRRHQSANN